MHGAVIVLLLSQQGPGCLAGGVYNFDDVTTDGSLPNRFLGLSWQGLRVTNSQRFSACDGNSGFRYGVVSGPNVAYSMEVGASGDMTNLVRITAPTPSSRISVLGFTATAAWQVSRRSVCTAPVPQAAAVCAAVLLVVSSGW
jgi:hypothetical protein